MPPDSHLRQKCTTFHFHCGSAPYPAGGAYSALPDPIAIFKGPSLKGREGEEEGEAKGMGRKVEGNEEEGREGEGPGPQYFGLEPPLPADSRSS